MQGLRWLQMTDDEMSEFLGAGGTGVISFATDADESPVSIPVSYGFNDGEMTFYFQLSFPKDSEKADLVDQPVSFVAYDRVDGLWRSVVASGELEDVADAPYESTTVQGMWAIQIPRVDIFERPRDEITFRDFRLDPETISGRKEVPSDS